MLGRDGQNGIQGENGQNGQILAGQKGAKGSVGLSGLTGPRGEPGESVSYFITSNDLLNTILFNLTFEFWHKNVVLIVDKTKTRF